MKVEEVTNERGPSCGCLERRVPAVELGGGGPCYGAGGVWRVMASPGRLQEEESWRHALLSWERRGPAEL